MSRGPKRGTFREFSIVAKMRTLDVGESLYLDDRETPGLAATHMERSVRNLIVKSEALAGRRFATARWAAVQTGPLVSKMILEIRRTE